MKASKKVSLSFEGIALIFVLAACNLPIKSPTPFVFPTPNLTQTSVFDTTVLPPVTETPSTLATVTSGAPTNTLVPAATNTLPSTATNLPPLVTATGIPPTITPIPPTATIPFARTSPQAVAVFLSKAPTINGTWDDLPSSTEKPANYVVYRNPAYTGTATAGMSYRLAWDANYLYVGVKVGDPNYSQRSTGKDIYLGDSVEILIDSNVSNDYSVSTLSLDDFQLGISPGKGKAGNSPEAYLWFPSGTAGSRSDVKIAAVNPSNGLYRIEIAIPWKLFGITPNDGMHLGFVISYSDNEILSNAEQDVMISNDKNRLLTDPTTWGDLLLTK